MHCRLLSLAMRQQWTDEDALSCTLLSTNHVYVLCESASKHAVPRCMLRTASVLFDPPAVRYAESCGKCSGCTRGTPRRASTERLSDNDLAPRSTVLLKTMRATQEP